MLTRIFLIIAIVAGLAVGGLNFFMVKQKVDDLVSDRNNERTQKQQALTKLSQTEQQLADTEKDLKDTKATLADTSDQLKRSMAEATAQTQRANELTEKLRATTTERDDAKANLQAYELTGFTPQQILGLGKQLRDLEKSLEVALNEQRILTRANTILNNKLAALTNPEHVVPLPAGLKGKVLVVDPKWDFVILNFGADQNVLEDGELLVSRDGKLVAKLRIRSIQKDRCVANVVEGWRIGDVAEGDLVIPAHVPAT